MRILYKVRLGYANNGRGPMWKDIIKPLCYYGSDSLPLDHISHRAHILIAGCKLCHSIPLDLYAHSTYYIVTSARLTVNVFLSVLRFAQPRRFFSKTDIICETVKRIISSNACKCLPYSYKFMILCRT